VDHAAPPKRSTIAGRVLASFAVTLLAFAVTVGVSVMSQQKAAKDSEELVRGYVPVALKLGQLRAVVTTLATLVDGAPDERNPSTRLLLETLVKVRRAKLTETRQALSHDLYELGSDETRERSLLLTGELDAAEALLGDEREPLEKLLAALDSGDKDAINRAILTLGAVEHECDKRLRLLSDHLAQAMDQFGAAAKERERRAIYQLAGLGVLTFVVGILVSLYTRRVLSPLEKMTDRAKDVARGDLEPKPPLETGDEIAELSQAFEKMVFAVGKAQSRAVANERLAAIGKMAAHVTHEIRNPLSSIGLNIELLDEELTTAGVRGESKNLLGSITREVSRLEQLSEEYLRVARLPSPRMEAENLAELVTDVANFARPEAERAHCTLSVDIEKGELPAALFDEAQLRQALLNLLRNAREAMPDGGEISLSVGALGMSVLVSVQDRGTGIPDAVRAKIFDPFFSTKGEGTGLGLAITRQIVEAHGGSLACEARDGGGTTFTIALPIAPLRSKGYSGRHAAT
jgi:signal transduction histidine kinase